MEPVLGPTGQHRPRPGNTGKVPWPPAPRDRRPEEGKRLTPDLPHNAERSTPPGRPLTIPAARSPPQGMQGKGRVPGLHARTPAPAARRMRTPTACPEGGQPGEDWRLASDATHNGRRHRSRGCPPATPTARNAGSQERALWSPCWCWAPAPTPPAPGKHGQQGLAARPQGRTARRGKAPDTRGP